MSKSTHIVAGFDQESARKISYAQLREQIGRGTEMGVTGFRTPRQMNDSTIWFACGNGYHVSVHIADNDTYTVRRMFVRGAKVWVKGEQANVYAEQLDEVFYRAGMFHDEWHTSI
jgi:hypothetical protein